MLPMRPEGTHFPILSSKEDRTSIQHAIIIFKQCHNCHRYYNLQQLTLCGPKSRDIPYATLQRKRRRPCTFCQYYVQQERGFSSCLKSAAGARALKISVYSSKYRSLRIPVLFKSTHATAEREVLIDSGATDNFINSQLLKRLRISYIPVPNPIKIWKVDGTLNQDGNITHYTDLQVKTGKETHVLRFLITNLGRDEVILGYPWFTAFELLPDAPKTLDCKVYPLAITEGDALTEFLNEQLEKGYIRPSKSPYASPFFFIKKK